MTDKIVVVSTCGSAEEAAKIARLLVDKQLAACVNIVPGAQSVYRWQGAVEETAEWLLLIKSRRDLFGRLYAEVQRAHSYEVPELVALTVVDGSPGYLSWMEKELAEAE
jgi:periplasmic divalent cation tolerance protein